MSRKHRKRRRSKPGTPPGMLTVDPDAPQSVIRLMAYGPERMEEKDHASLDDVRRVVGKFPVVWVNVDGLGDAHAIEGIADIFGLHRLALEDVVNLHQRPKLERYDAHEFLVAYVPRLAEKVEMEQLSLFLGIDFVVTFQVLPEDCLTPVRDRIRQGRPRLRNNGPGYLTYAILDTVVDSYFPILEGFGDRLETLDMEILDNPTQKLVGELHEFKRELLNLRRAIWPFREVIAAMTREESPFIPPETRVYLRDVQDHSIQLVELLESMRESATSLIDLYLSSVSQRMNEVMKVLTIIATIFIPLSFVAGLYGMNFNGEKSPFNMPELNWYFGYPMALGVMLLVAVVMLFYFKRKGWLD